MKRKRHSRGFTIVELLVVMAIIGTLTGLLLPAVNSARESARKLSCKNNLRQVGIAMHNYESSFRHLPPGYQYEGDSAGNQSGHSWASHLLPYLELPSLHDRIDFRQPVFDASNEIARTQHIKTLLCPSDGVSPTGFVGMGDDQFAMACYVANFGSPDLDEDQEQKNYAANPTGPFQSAWGPFFRNSKMRFKKIKDGLTKTLMIGERENGPFRTAGTHGSHFEYETTWFGAVRDIEDPTDDHGHMVLFQTGHTPNSTQSDDRDVSASHDGVAQYLFCDGSVDAVSEDVNLDVYRALGTINGRETVEGL